MLRTDQEDVNTRRLLDSAIQGGVHSPLHVTIQPAITLRDFFLFRIPNGEVHLCGWHIQDGEGRVSTELVAYEPAERLARTRSGRRYSLVGDGGRDADAAWVASIWCRRNGVTFSESMILPADEAAVVLTSLAGDTEAASAENGRSRSA